MRRYLEALEATFMVRVLKPLSTNLGKRQVKAPKQPVAEVPRRTETGQAPG